MAIYVCSDIHGQYDLYKEMLGKINFSDEDELYILGDMIDRGPDSISILRDVAVRENVHCLMGNHELMMYDYFHHGSTGSYWFNRHNGGKRTYDALMSMPEEEREAIMNLVDNLYLQVELEINNRKFLLSHSSFWVDCQTIRVSDVIGDKNVNPYAVQDLVWCAPWRMWEYTPLEVYSMDGREHIVGHVPVQYIKPQEWPKGDNPPMPSPLIDETNHIVNIDLGCASIPEAQAQLEDGRIDKNDIANLRFSLCAMNLTRYAENKEDAFLFIEPEYDDETV